LESKANPAVLFVLFDILKPGSLSSMSRQPYIVYLFSDTGGGHRSAAQAIMEAMDAEYPACTRQEMLDIFGAYAPGILRKVPQSYPPLSRRPRLLGWIFHRSDGMGRTRLFLRFLWPFVRRNLRSMLRDHPADLFVSVHPLINPPLGHALDALHIPTPYLTVVTDLVTAHATWFWKRADKLVVPTQAAAERGIRYGYPADRLHVIGLPVAGRVAHPKDEDPAAIRRRLEWPEDRPVILLVGGGEGMGPLEVIAKALDSARLPANLVVVAGRNAALRARLEQHAWQTPTRIYGFTREMPDFMRAAHILVTKAGPGTISEALCAGLPMVLYSRMDGAEEGNEDYVTHSRAGVYAPRPDQVVQAVSGWLDQPAAREEAARCCLAAARPQAARDIARLIAEILHLRQN
jgi:1,2-diacylglycerol 3-beta-galactosyltransferase